MNKEEMLKKAFSHTLTNAALRFADHDIDALIMRQDMIDFAARNNFDLTEDEIEEYIDVQIKKMEASVKDFTYQTRMMKNKTSILPITIEILPPRQTDEKPKLCRLRGSISI